MGKKYSTAEAIAEATRLNEESPAPVEVEPSEFPVTLNEWCVETSKHDRRMELLHAFQVGERAKGHIKDMSAEFSKRYAEFAVAPAQ